MKDKKDKQCRFIFTAAFVIFTKGANISGGHCVYIYIYIYTSIDNIWLYISKLIIYSTWPVASYTIKCNRDTAVSYRTEPYIYMCIHEIWLYISTALIRP